MAKNSNKGSGITKDLSNLIKDMEIIYVLNISNGVKEEIGKRIRLVKSNGYQKKGMKIVGYADNKKGYIIKTNIGKFRQSMIINIDNAPQNLKTLEDYASEYNSSKKSKSRH